MIMSYNKKKGLGVGYMSTVKHEFGGIWTKQKLDIIDNYLEFYVKALKNQKFRLCYIDAFAGSGTVTIKGGREITGSAIRSLKHEFDLYQFFESDEKKLDALKEQASLKFQNKNVQYYNTDCNAILTAITTFEWKKNGWRGVIFLDPYAMDLSWQCLEEISKTKAYDVWYLFPFMAINRNLRRDGKIDNACISKLNNILGTDTWKDCIYSEPRQLSFLDDHDLEKTDVEGVKNYILSRLKSTFPTVSDKAALLKNDKNSPLFLLCFAGSNPSRAAKELSLRAADYILKNI